MDCEKRSRGLEATKHEESGGSRSQGPFHGIIEDFGRPHISEWNSHKYIQTQLDTFRRLDIMPPQCCIVQVQVDGYSPFRRCPTKGNVKRNASPSARCRYFVRHSAQLFERAL